MIFTLLFLSISDPTSSLSLLTFSPYVYLSYIFLLYASFTLTTPQQENNLISAITTMWSTWLLILQNSPFPGPPPDPVLEPLQLSSLTPTDQSSGLPKHRAQVGVH